MFAYIVGVLAIGIFCLNPILQFFIPERSTAQRSPVPQLNKSLLALETNATLACPQDAYSIHIFSKAPLVIYIENFLSADERSHLLEISDPLYQPSTVTHDGTSTHRDASVRDSEVALVPRTPAVQCVEARARALQGWRAGELWIERLRVQRYRPGGHYGHHFDWRAARGSGWGRVSSMMVFVDDGDGGLKGGGTEFPLLRVPADEGGRGRGRWCRFVECPEDGVQGEKGSGERRGEGGEGGSGVVFKAIPGNAVFWENFRPDGSGVGYEETWHAGLPVHEGVKVGLNIWSFGRID